MDTRNLGISLDEAVVTITPELARDLLARNNYNIRTVNNGRVKRIAKDILANQWDTNGETIKLDSEGNLVDGQHRLWGCVKANRCIRAVVLRDVPVQFSLNIDTGGSRSLAVFLRNNGEKYAAGLAASLVVFWDIEHGTLRSCKSRTMATRNELIALLDQHPELRTSAKKVSNLKYLEKSLGGAFHYKFSQIDSIMADEFLAAINGDLPLRSGDPMYLLRERLIRDRTSRSRPDKVHRCALIIKAWNLWREDRSVSRLTWQSTGAHAEAFPEII